MNTIAKTVDRLGMIKAQIADLKKQESDLKAALIFEGFRTFDGDLYQATVYNIHKETLDKEAIELAIEKAGFSKQYITAHTIKTDTPTVRVSARSVSKKNEQPVAA